MKEEQQRPNADGGELQTPVVAPLGTEEKPSHCRAENFVSAKITGPPSHPGLHEEIQYLPSVVFLRAVKDGLATGFQTQIDAGHYRLEETSQELALREDSLTYGWSFGMTREFQKQVDSIDRKLQGRIFQAITEITSDPISPKGDTIKRLTGEWKDYWRYRIGDFRLVYFPDLTSHRITLWSFAARGGIYD